MTLQEFESRGQDYADLRDALREIATLRAVHVELLAACEMAQLAFRATSKAAKDYTPELEILNAAIAKAHKEVAS